MKESLDAKYPVGAAAGRPTQENAPVPLGKQAVCVSASQVEAVDATARGLRLRRCRGDRLYDRRGRAKREILRPD